ncbi:unnamed protein product, partial [Symbiodinium sp. KB8]
MAGEHGRERSRSPSARRAFWQAQLEAIYTRRNPAKLSTIPELLKKFDGQEAVLYTKVCHKYDLNPTKFHTERDAWREYDLTVNHGPLPAASSPPLNAAPVDVTVVTPGGSTAEITGLLPTQTVKDLLQQAANRLNFPVWCSKLCKQGEDHPVDIDLKLHAAGVTSGMSLTLVQEAEPEVCEALERFRSGDAGSPASVFVALQVTRPHFGPLSSSLIGVFKHKTDAIEAATVSVRQAWGQ